MTVVCDQRTALLRVTHGVRYAAALRNTTRVMLRLGILAVLSCAPVQSFIPAVLCPRARAELTCCAVLCCAPLQSFKESTQTAQTDRQLAIRFGELDSAGATQTPPPREFHSSLGPAPDRRPAAHRNYGTPRQSRAIIDRVSPNPAHCSDRDLRCIVFNTVVIAIVAAHRAVLVLIHVCTMWYVQEERYYGKAKRQGGGSAPPASPRTHEHEGQGQEGEEADDEAPPPSLTASMFQDEEDAADTDTSEAGAQGERLVVEGARVVQGQSARVVLPRPASASKC